MEAPIESYVDGKSSTSLFQRTRNKSNLRKSNARIQQLKYYEIRTRARTQVREVLATGKSTYVSKKYKIPLRTLRRYTAAERRRLKCLREVVESPHEQDFFFQENASDEDLEDFLVSWFVLENDVESSKKNQGWEWVPISEVL